MQRTTIVVPCFNEADRLDVSRYGEFIQRHHEVNLLLVNDGSNDSTLDVMESIRHICPHRVRLLDLTRNVGKAEAVRQGMLAAISNGADLAGYWDADLATPLETVRPFAHVLQSRRQHQAVIGSRLALLGHDVRRRRMRRMLGDCFARAASWVLRAPVHDTQCGAKLFRITELTTAAFQSPFLSRWIFDVEILARLAAHGPLAELVYEFPLDSWQDVAGSKLKPRHFFTAAFELAAIWRQYRKALRSDRTLAAGVAPLPAPGAPPATAGHDQHRHAA